MKKRRISRRLLIETNFGRKCGWYVEFNGQKVARLVDPQREEMFWDNYLVEPLTRDADMLSLLDSADFWLAGTIVYRNCAFEEWTPNAFAGGDAAKKVAETNRISMRGLYLTPPQTWWERLLSWLMATG